VTFAISRYCDVMCCGRRELSTTCLSSVRQLSSLTRLTVSPTQLNDQVLLGVADACVSLHRLVLVEDRYSEYSCRRAAEVGKVSSRTVDLTTEASEHLSRLRWHPKQWLKLVCPAIFTARRCASAENAVPRSVSLPVCTL